MLNVKTKNWLKSSQNTTDSLIMPYFVTSGREIKQPIPWLPGIYKYSLDILLRELEGILELGVRSVILFESAQVKDEKMLFSPDNLIARCVKEIHRFFPELVVTADLCMCSHTVSGHCRLSEGGVFSRTRTLRALRSMAVNFAVSGADIISPSGMLKGQTKAIKKSLQTASLEKVAIMPAVKSASVLYQPARSVFSQDRVLIYPKPYHLPVGDGKAVLNWCRREISEGADIIMIKPAVTNLDIICRAAGIFKVPVTGFQPSGNYALLKFGMEKCGFKEKELVLEELTSILRAGARKIVTYFAAEIASYFKS